MARLHRYHIPMVRMIVGEAHHVPGRARINPALLIRRLQIRMQSFVVRIRIVACHDAAVKIQQRVLFQVHGRKDPKAHLGARPLDMKAAFKEEWIKIKCQQGVHRIRGAVV